MPGSTSPRQVLGIPVVPSVSLARAVRFLRRLLGRMGRRTALPPLAIQEALAGIYDNRVLGLLVELGLPDRLDRPRTAADLAAELGADAESLDRVLRYAASRGFVRARRGGRYGRSPVSEFLRESRSGSWAPIVRRASGEWFWEACRDLDRAIGVERVDPDAPAADPELTGTAIQALALSRGVHWGDVGRVCDVGAGPGVAVEVLLQEHPALHATVFDRPEVVAEARSALTSGTLAARCRIVGGDFLVAVPPGCDRYLLMAVMTECDDDRAVTLLATVRAAMGPHARLLVVDNVLSEQPRDEYAQLSDLFLLVLGVGKERTRRQYHRLFTRAGLVVVTEHELFTGSTAFELAVSSPEQARPH